MRRNLSIFLASLILGILIVWCVPKLSPTQVKDESTPTLSPNPTPQPSLSPAASEKEVFADDILTSEDRLTYKDFVLEKRSRKAKIDSPPEYKSKPLWVDVYYAILKRRGKFLAKFDADIYFGLGNGLQFGLYPLLGNDTKQLIISQDVPRWGNQWIVNLSPSFRIIYDGTQYGTGREGPDMGIVDIDNDGVYEIIQPITDFYNFQDKLAMSQIPLPRIIFKYDAKAGKYLPANTNFQDYLLEGIEQQRNNISDPAGNNSNHLSDVLHVVLQYIYVGKEDEAWAFYERAYKLPDKGEIKSRIKEILKNQKIYQLMYKQNRRARVN